LERLGKEESSKGVMVKGDENSANEKLEKLEERKPSPVLVEDIETSHSEIAYSQNEEEFGGESQKIRQETWKGLVDFARARNPVLGSFLALGNLVHLSDEKVVIGFEKDSFHYERMLEKENRDLLELLCYDYFQKKPKVIISPLDPEMRSKENFKAERVVRNEGEKRLEKGAEENPLIQKALRLFNGRIVE
jgi:hypothetical protein